eukprot:TRINITY_DN2596_c0_g3_i1.p1 TRINITY_DN2596_c0_g3~~TRINITY_DN2596_c0_g3_i1.p1  ORF type:complete len:107 (-),score=26.26 TRINITY_DN2596_c0_g3_i1:75-395(-)
MFALRFCAFAVAVCMSTVDASGEFLPATQATEAAKDVTLKASVSEASSKQAEVIGMTQAKETVIEAKEIELDAATNPYMHTGPTAEALALLFMMVSCMICYLECCK